MSEDVLNEWVNSFVDYIYMKNSHSDHTADSYRRDLMQFVDFLKRENISSFNDVTYPIVLNFISEIRYGSKMLNNRSIARKCSALRSFCSYLEERKIVIENPFIQVKLGKNKRKLPDFLFVDEIDNLFESIDISNEMGMRNRVLLELIYASGLRVSEAANLCVGDIDLDECFVRVLGKGKKERIVPFYESIRDLLRTYLQTTRTEIMLKNNQHHNYLFVSLKGEQLTTRGIQYILNEQVKRSGLSNSVHPHTLRHSFATHLLDGGCDLRIVQELLGHSSLSTTQIYVHTTTQKLKVSYFKTHPRANFK